MYVCLCLGVTNHTVTEVVSDGAATPKEVAAACGAGSGCNQCWRTIRAIIAAAADEPRRARSIQGTHVEVN